MISQKVLLPYPLPSRERTGGEVLRGTVYFHAPWRLYVGVRVFYETIKNLRTILIISPGFVKETLPCGNLFPKGGKYLNCA
jgi:hypothetical protein